MNKDADDNLLQFTFNGSMVNKNFEKILDIIGEKLKTKKQIIDNRDKIIKLLSCTFIDITPKKLADGFNTLYSEIQEVPFKYKTIEDLNNSINRYSTFILEIQDQFKDHGYSMLLCGYFWLINNYLKNHKIV